MQKANNFHCWTQIRWNRQVVLHNWKVKILVKSRFHVKFFCITTSKSIQRCKAIYIRDTSSSFLSKIYVSETKVSLVFFNIWFMSSNDLSWWVPRNELLWFDEMLRDFFITISIYNWKLKIWLFVYASLHLNTKITLRSRINWLFMEVDCKTNVSAIKSNDCDFCWDHIEQ